MTDTKYENAEQDRVSPHQTTVAMTPQDEYYHNARALSLREGDVEEYTEKPPPPPKRPFYKNKKYWIICSIITVIVVVVVVLLIIFVFFPKIVQSLINQSNIGVDEAQITFGSLPNQSTGPQKRDLDPQSTFNMHMKSQLGNAGPFSAEIKFINPINVMYNDTLLGNITLPDTHIVGGKGSLDAQTPFIIQDVDQFAAFSRDMLAKKTFDWTLKGKVQVTALSRTSTADLNKVVTIEGMNGFPDVKISSFQLPGNAPQGGILVELGTVMNSPSPIGVQLGTIKLEMGYDGVTLGQVAASGVNLQQGDNNILLKGVLVPQNDSASLDKISTMFSNYVSGKPSLTTARGLSAAPDGTNPVSWLSQGFQSVQLNVALAAAEPLKIINAVNMGYLDLAFNPDSPYSPMAHAPNVVADFTIPFGFSLNITDVSQNIQLGTNNTDGGVNSFAQINVPMVPAKSDQQAGKLEFPINNSPIATLPGQEQGFNQYTYDLTASNVYSFQVSGNATTKAQTPIGPITLSGISFSVPTSLHGLQFLNSTPTVINSVDMTGGTSDALQLAINVTMGNPSDFSMSTGDVHFAMIASDVRLGTVLLSNLTLNRGSNTVVAIADFDPNSSDVGHNVLNTFVMGQDNGVSIGGYNGSTAVASLAQALGSINIDTTLPGLPSALVQYGQLTVLPDTPQTGTVFVKVALANPFTAGLQISKVVSSATFDGMPIGNINQDLGGSPISAPGKNTTLSPNLNMTMNVQPAAVALLMRTLAVKSNMDTKALDALLGMGGLQVPGMDSVSPDPSVFSGFNISSYTMQAMQALKVDLQLNTDMSVGSYNTNLQFSQKAVQIKSDDSVTTLIPIVGQPIVQHIVDGSKLVFDTIVLSNPTDTSFAVQMTGSITNTGPMDSEISFPTPLTIAWQGKVLGTVTMTPLQAKAGVGATINATGTFTIANQDDMGTFSAYMINNKDFVWDVRCNNVNVNALGFTFTGVNMEKFVTLAGANGFKDAVTINSFDLPANEPGNAGIQLVAQTTIKNPSQVGFNLNGVGFATYFGDVYIGPLASDGNAVFPPRGSSNMAMKGSLVPQSSQEGLDAVTKVFENYLSGNDSILTVNGVSGSGPSGSVSWLTAGFKTLSIQNVVLPGPKTIPKLISSVTMKDMELDFTKDAYAPPSGSNQVEAQLKSPFGFPLGVSQLNMDVTASANGQSVAELKVPDEKASTSSTNLVTTQFSNVPFQVVSNAQPDFDDFVKALTSTSQVTFGLAGTTNAVADTAVGPIKLNAIGLDVQTSLAGFNNFGGQTKIVSMSVVGGTSEHVLIDTQISFNNPSAITITIGDVNFDAVMNENNAVVGKVFLTDVVIKPGENTFKTQFQLGGSSTSAISQMLTNYMTAAKVPMTILGTEGSTPIASLKSGFSTVKLSTEMQGIQSNLISSVKVSAKLVETLVTKKASAYVTLHNPLQTSLTLTKVNAVVSFSNGGSSFTVGRVESIPSPVTIPAGGSITSDAWPVTVEANIGQLLELMAASDKSMDMTQNVTVIVGDNGYNADMYYYQNHVPSTLDISTLGIPLPLGGSNNATASANGTTTASTTLNSSTVSATLPASTSSASTAASRTSGDPTSTITSTETAKSTLSSTEAKTTDAPTSSSTTDSGDSTTTTTTTTKTTTASKSGGLFGWLK